MRTSIRALMPLPTANLPSAAQYRNHLCHVLKIPLTDTINLTGYIDLGKFVATGGFGHALKASWNEAANSLAKGLHALPDVALKVVSLPALKEETENENHFGNVKHELELRSRISHDNILPLIAFAYISGDANIPVLISPWIEHGNVMEFLERNPSFPAVNFLRDIIEGLCYLHSFNPEIVHGDIKASNVLINHKKVACLCDFGLHRFVANDSFGDTTLKQASGALRWMAPELLEGEESIPTKASDMYAYGMTCYEILTGKVPFESIRNDFAVISKVIRGYRPDRVVSCFPDEIWSIITQCWPQQPDGRLSTSGALKLMRGIIGGHGAETEGAFVIPSLNFLTDIPSVIVCEILEYLDYRSLLKCRVVCSDFRDLVDSTPTLQYKIELALAGQEDGGRYQLSVRREMLKLHQKGWTELAWTAELFVPMLDGDIWELCGSILAESNDDPLIIRFYQLPSKSRGLEQKEWSIPATEFQPDDIGMDPDQDLLVIIEKPQMQQTCHIFKIHLRTLSTGEPHPSASGPSTLTYEQNLTNDDEIMYCVVIYCHTLGILFKPRRSPQRGLALWNWKTGQNLMCTVSEEITSMTILSERHVLLGVLWQISGPKQPCLMVVDFIAESPQRQGLGTLQNALTFCFPSLACGTVIQDLIVRSNPAATWTQDSELPFPFFTASDNRIYVVYFLMDHQVDRALCFVGLESALLSLINSTRLPSSNRRFDWSDWGPDSTRSIRDLPFSRAWRWFAYGTRFVGTRSSPTDFYVDVYDFNQLAMRYYSQRGEGTATTRLNTDGMKAQGGVEEEANHQLIYVTTPTRLMAGDVFHDQVETKLGYGLRSWQVHEANIESVPAMCSEDGIVLVDLANWTYRILTV